VHAVKEQCWSSEDRQVRKKTGKYRIAVIEFTQQERRNKTGRNVMSKQPADLFQTMNVIKTRTGDFVDMTL